MVQSNEIVTFELQKQFTISCLTIVQTDIFNDPTKVIMDRHGRKDIKRERWCYTKKDLGSMDWSVKDQGLYLDTIIGNYSFN